ncbi:ATP-dependent helicase DinG [Paenibacillus baekrokdamisoli]|uniref:3'-5' exonuclease DinG n=1 Tax=Paenibacillus baekrokdamisoli TaxID=1712516 RepID=A0A3G9IRM4_9BACL|nr:ATP-dependent DNA helicase DinG [Paenibacillus baekrokdamisoli]MBB3069694.1 ATP-dependent DNA helicase DinG [Paenibacillus baekrokdamisoli]BBH20952.1 ATP-dependent helicase DinG [Paenibacillus baekrokdamisoli]
MNYAVLDLETTGHGAGDEMIQVGLVLLDESMQIVRTYHTFVKPTIPIPPFITQLTGIDASMVEDAPSVEDVLLELIPILDDAVLVAHNVGFDAGFLNMALDRSGYMPFAGRQLDTIDLLRVLYPSLTTYQLGAVTELFGIEHDHHHRADSDAKATAELFIECFKKLSSLPLLTLQRLSGLLSDEIDDLGWFVEQMAVHKETMTSIDTDAYVYFRQFAMKAGDWTEEQLPRGENGEADQVGEWSFHDFLTHMKDSIRSIVPGYEEREPQNMMFQEVIDALESDRHLLIEAGTGTGKSLGYLIPALYYGVQHNKKIVVSTHTINLQEQLRQRDLPLLQAVMPYPFRAAVFKGRGNYLCLRKFEGKVHTRDFAAPVEDRITSAQMVVWLSETENGDQEELNFGNRGAEFWSTVSSDADSCLNRSCPWFKRCYYHRAKQEANLADVVITNHSMLFTDIRADHRLLPGFEHLIVDEAHHLEEVAGKHLGTQLSYHTVQHPVGRLCKDARNGQLIQLKHRIANEDTDYADKWQEEIDSVVPVFGELRDEWDRLFDLLFSLLGAGNGGPQESSSGETGQFILRLRSSKLPSKWQDAQAIEEVVNGLLSQIIRPLDKMFQSMKDECKDPALIALVTDLSGTVKDLTRARDELRQFMKADKAENVYWIEANSNFRAKSIHLYAVPADVSSQLRSFFFDTKKSVVLTSATLSVQKSFQYACEQLGLEQDEEHGRLKTVQLPSPFNYRDQALVIIPRNFPVLKGAAGDPLFNEMLVKSLAEAAIETKGRMLVLFTSYKMLKQVYDPLKEALMPSGIQLLGQGIDSGNRSKLTRRFQQQAASVLLGTSSFWEGVDIPGDALTCLAIVRLPFQPPNNPLVEAKSEMLQEQKLNPFMKLSIPQAVIKFKQGFGRLVRTTKDRGIVLIYDTRVIDTYYGKYFLYSLPGPKIEHMHLEQIVPRIREWLASGHGGIDE